MAYIEEEMRKRRGENKVADASGGSSKGAAEKRKRDGPVDIYEELYQIPDRLKVKVIHCGIRNMLGYSLYMT